MTFRNSIRETMREWAIRSIYRFSNHLGSFYDGCLCFDAR